MSDEPEGEDSRLDNFGWDEGMVIDGEAENKDEPEEE